MVSARLATRIVDFAMMLVLARILRPADFGLVAIAMSMVFVVEAALELPVNQALLRLPAISRRQYDTAFTLSALRGAVLAGLLVALAWPFAGFYDDPRLAPLVCVLSLAPAARGLQSPLLAEYQKKLSFWRDFVIELSGKLAGFAVGLTIALVTRSYWALAAGTVAYPLTMAFGSYGFAPYRPRLTLAELPLFSGFIGWMSAAQIISAVNWQFERLLLGKLQAPSRLGLFTTANDIASIPLLAIFGPLLRPLLAAFALLREDTARLRRSYQTASCGIVAIGLPLLVGQSLVAEPAIRLILGEKWLGAAPLLQGLALSMIPGLFALPANPLFMAFGNTKIFLKRNTIEICVKIPLAIYGGITFGFWGIIVARCVSEISAVTFCVIVVRRFIGLPIAEQMFAPWRSIMSTAVMAAVVALYLRVPAVGADTVLHAAARVAIAAAIGTTAYGGVMLGLWLACGRPAGVEALAAATLSALTARLPRARRRKPGMERP